MYTMEKYKEFGDMVKKIVHEENPEGADLYFVMMELVKIGKAINEGELLESDVDLVFDDSGISLEMLETLIQKFLSKLINQR